MQDIKQLVSYDPDTGEFTRLRDSSRGIKAGDKAGCVLKSTGYVRLCVGGEYWLGHRLAVFLMTGRLPPADVDHINGIRHDNRWANLRCVTRSQNMQNMVKAQSNNKAGMLGVATGMGTNRGWFYPVIWVGKKRMRLGGFKTPEEAHSVYIAAKKRLHIAVGR